MRRCVVAFSCLALVGFGLAGCGLSRFEQREPWRQQAEEACLSQKLVQQSAYMSRRSEISGPGTCGMVYPFQVAAFADGSVGVTRNLTLACPMIPRVEIWLAEVVQPAAAASFGTSVAEIRSGSYACRSRNSQRGAKLSEHAFGNAVDVMAFRLADGREVSIVKGWRGAPEEQEFLREVFVGACQHFTTVLGPGADPFHYDHFHLDLARHDPRGERRICKPVLKFTPRSEVAAPAPRAAPLRNAPALQAPEAGVEVEEDEAFEGETAAAAPPARLAGPRPQPAIHAQAALPAPFAGRPDEGRPDRRLPSPVSLPPRALPPPAAAPEPRPSSPAYASARAGAGVVRGSQDDPFAAAPAPRRAGPGPAVLPPQRPDAHAIY